MARHRRVAVGSWYNAVGGVEPAAAALIAGTIVGMAISSGRAPPLLGRNCPLSLIP